MKRLIWSTIAVFAICLTACFDDDSSLGDSNYSDIEISELQDTTIVSFMGNYLTINPEIKTAYDTATLTYAWYLCESDREDVENGYRENKIAETKMLNYEVNLASGLYTIVFEATSGTDGLTRTASLELTTVTSFSDGFYILKETADGNSDLDIYGINGLSEDILSGMFGSPISGSPTNLSVTFDHPYVEEETADMAGTHMIHVFTDANEYRGYRTEDLTLLFDNNSLRFDGLDSDEIPYSMPHGMMSIFFLSNKGVYSTYPCSTMPSSGTLGLPTEGGEGASKYIISIGGGMLGYYYWNNTAHTLYTVDYNVSLVNPVEYEVGNVNEANLTCIASGENMTGYTATGCFVCEDEVTGDRYLYLVDLMSGSVETPRRLDASLNIAQAEILSVLGQNAPYIYVVNNGEVFAYNWEEDSEVEVSLPGLSDSETITYLSNQYLNSIMASNLNFDDIIVATQEGNSYKLYFYESLVGGIPNPNEQPTIVEGTGRVKSVRYTSAAFDIMDFIFASPLYGYPPLFPYVD